MDVAFTTAIPLAIRTAPAPSCSARRRPSASIAPAPPKTETPATRVAARLQRELPRIFDEDGCPQHYNLFASDVEFRDPLNSFRGAERYRANIRFLGSSILFGGASLVIHDTRIVSPSIIDTRWTLGMRVRALPWLPHARFTGTSRYVLDDEGRVVQHLDAWDSLPADANEASFSFAAVADFLGQVRAKPRVPPYKLLRRTTTLEIREYDGVPVTPVKAEGPAIAVDGVEPIGTESWEQVAKSTRTVAVARLRNGVDVELQRKELAEAVRQAGFARVLDGGAVVRYASGKVSEVMIPIGDVVLTAESLRE